MNDPLLLQLKEVADKALKSENIEEGMKHLAQAFSLFSEETHRFKTSYNCLRERFENVNEELEQSNLQLINKIKELNSISCYLNNILKNISQGIIFVDTEGVISTCNEEAKKILEITDNILFKNFWEVFSDNIFGFPMKSSLQSKRSEKLSYLNLITKEGKTKYLELSTTYIFDAPKAYQGLIVILKDITDIHKLQIVANRNDRMKEIGEMAATVAHEIRNPLGGIRGYASLLYRDLQNSKHLQEMSGYIIEGTKTLERLVNNVLHYSRTIELKLTYVNITKFLIDICKFVQADPTFSSEIILDCHIPKEELFIPIDEGLFRSVLLNLLVNAYQAIVNTGTVTVSLLKNNDTCIISISDTGTGIPSKNLENIFSPFFTTKTKGNGLGLSEAYKIVQAHFGTIDVRSQLDFGTTFTINLPIKGKDHVYK